MERRRNAGLNTTSSRTREENDRPIGEGQDDEQGTNKDNASNADNSISQAPKSQTPSDPDFFRSAALLAKKKEVLK